MSGDEPFAFLATVSVAALAAGMLLLMLAAGGAGHVLGQLRRKRGAASGAESEPSIAQENYLFGTMLATLGLLLAFTFGMVLQRYEARRTLVVQEANAIGTAYLRSQFLDEPHRSRLSKLLIEYTENRIEIGRARKDRKLYLARNDELISEMWAALRASRESALEHGVTTPLLLTYNELIDIDLERRVAWDLRLPGEVVMLLLAYLAATAAIAGYQVDGPRGRRAAIAMFLLLMLSIAVIADVNRPESGIVTESRRPLLLELESLKAQPVRTFDRYLAKPTAVTSNGR